MKYLITLLLTTFLFAQEEGWETDLAPVPSHARNHPVNFTLDGKGYLLTGFASALQDDPTVIPVLNDFYEYDPITDNWSQLPNFGGSPRGFSYGETYNGKAYVGFGLGLIGQGFGYLNDLWEYDPETEEWTQLQDVPFGGRVAGTQFAHNGKGYVLSGQDNNHQNFTEGFFHEYDPETDTWRDMPSHPGESRWAPGNFVIGPWVYFMGGQYQLDFDPGEGEDQSTMMKFPLEINSSVELETENVIYPNPVYTNLNINLDENLDQVKVYNSQGKEVFMTDVNAKQINLDNLNSGGYIIEINTPNKKYINKFVKSEK